VCDVRDFPDALRAGRASPALGWLLRLTQVNARSSGRRLPSGFSRESAVEDSNELHARAAECLRQLRDVRDRAERERLIALMKELVARAEALERARWAGRDVAGRT
jgi:hypothetical protein